MVRSLLVAGASYLLGSIPTGILLARAKGVDLRSVGSGNIGATNVSRALGKRLGLVALLGDLGKGLAAALLARATLEDPWWIAGAGLLAVLGHLFPVWLRFQGGKGVATSLGVLLALVPLAGLAGVVTYAVLYARTRLSSLGSLAGATVAAAVAPFVTATRPFWALAVALLVLVVARHIDNIRRLLAGEEGKI